MKVGKTKRKCVICVLDFEKGEKIYKLPKCKHIYHEECFEPWIKKHDKCPMCRASLIV